MLGVPEAARLIRIALSVRDASGGEPVQPRGDFVWGRETVHKRLSISERTLLAIQEFEQRFLDVIIPLVPGFERKVLKTSDCFPLRHRRGDHRDKRAECEVLRAAFCEKIDRSVDKREY